MRRAGESSGFMNGLRELQRDFAHSVLSGDDRIADRIRNNGLDAVRRLAVYRNNTLLGLTEALKDSFPVVRRLVGDAFFACLARAFITAHPPRSGCLIGYGDRFPPFVAGYPRAAGLPYLSDVARLEWLRQEAFHEADAAPLEPARLGAVPAARHGELRFRLHPSARWLVSSYPVLHIWEVNQPAYAGDDRVALKEGSCRLLVFQATLTVEIRGLQPGEYAFLTALAADSTITSALERALTADEHFDLFGSVRDWIQRGVIINFSL